MSRSQWKASTILEKQTHMCVYIDYGVDGRAFRWEEFCRVYIPAAGDRDEREIASGEGHEGYAGTCTPCFRSTDATKLTVNLAQWVA